MSGSAPPSASGPREPGGTLLRSALPPTLGAGVLAVLVGALSGAEAAIGAAVGAALATAALAAGPLLLRASARWQPVMVMAVALVAYGVVVVALGAAYLALDGAGWLSHPHVGLGAAACTVVWLAAHIRASGRLRVLAFGSPGGREDA